VEFRQCHIRRSITVDANVEYLFFDRNSSYGKRENSNKTYVGRIMSNTIHISFNISSAVHRYFNLWCIRCAQMRKYGDETAAEPLQYILYYNNNMSHAWTCDQNLSEWWEIFTRNGNNKIINHIFTPYIKWSEILHEWYFRLEYNYFNLPAPKKNISTTFRENSFCLSQRFARKCEWYLIIVWANIQTSCFNRKR